MYDLITYLKKKMEKKPKLNLQKNVNKQTKKNPIL